MIIVDRFENAFAVIEENGVMKNIPRSLLGDGVTEGSVIVKKGEKAGLYTALDFGCVWLERALAGK